MSTPSGSVSPAPPFPDASPKSPGLRRLFEGAEDLCTVNDKARELVFDIKALVGGAFLAARESKDPLDSAKWLTWSLEPEAHYLDGLIGKAISNRENVRQLLSKGYTPIPSTSVKSVVVPRALELARLTVKRDEFAQRHLLVALLELPPEKWPDIGYKVTPERLARARTRIVEMTGENPEPGEDMDAWKKIIAAPLPDQPSEKLQAVDRLRTQRDDPAAHDQLGRRVFARVLADRITDARKDQLEGGYDRAFMIHLDGPWGSGKSSVLLQVKDILQKNHGWLVVDFNAWQSQSIEPPWWVVISEFARQVRHQLRGPRKWWFSALWLWWKLRNDFAPLAFAAILIAFGLLLLSGSQLLSGLGIDLPSLLGEGSLLGALSGAIFGDGDAVKGIVGLLTTIGGLTALGRTVFFGSSAAGQAVEKLRGDPYAPVMRLFGRLIAVAKRPVLVIIDDLDRCNADYVVSLLENIQTMLRREPITYFVAGDCKWLTTSFEKRYADFREPLGQLAKPLGHLFLEKVFQLSVGIPEMGGEAAERFWQGLVNREERGVAVTVPKQAEIDEAQKIIASETTEEGFKRRIDSTESPGLKRALQTEAAQRVGSSTFEGNLESRYAGYGMLLERNPRAIKRLVNKLALNLSVLFLEGREFTPGPLARWTIIQMRWPVLADRLRNNPHWLDDFSKADDRFGELLCNDVSAVLGSDNGADERLDTAALRKMLGP